jgi:hypothetical protein
MTRAEAERLAERLAREHPDRHAYTWLPRQDESADWSVVKIARPGGEAQPLKPVVEARPRPPYPGDPRPDRFAGRP